MSISKLLILDSSLSKHLRVAEKPGILRNLASLIAHSGDSWFWFLGLPILWYFSSDAWRYYALFVFVSIFLTAVVVLSIKFLVRRQRPEGEWGQIYRKTDPHSFPSGHATRGLLIGLLSISLCPLWFGIAMLCWGFLVGLARIAMGVHYFSDVLAGWLLSGLISLLLLKYLPMVLQPLHAFWGL